MTLHGVGYDAPDGRAILSNVSVDIRRGETLALIGRNGAGKSTLAAIIARLIEPSRGERRRGDERADVAYAFQSPEHQFVANTVREELSARLRPDGSARATSEPDSQIGALLDRLGLAHLADRHPFSLSQGEKRRLAILAAVTGHDAGLMVLDEPSHGLDAAGIERMIALVSDLRTPSRAIVLVSHDMDLVWRLADRVAVLSHGAIVADAPVDTAFARWPFLTIRGYGARLADPADDPPAALLGWLDLADRIEPVAGAMQPTLIHSDPTAGNWIDDGERLWLIDWEYAGFADPLVDIAALAADCGDRLDGGRLLHAQAGTHPDAGLKRRFAALVAAVVLRDAMWCLLASRQTLATPGLDRLARDGLARFEDMCRRLGQGSPHS